MTLKVRHWTDPGSRSAFGAKGVSGLIRAISNSVLKHARDDSGVSGLIIAGLIATIAFSALTVFLNKYIGDRFFERARASASGQGIIMPAMLAHYLSQDSLTRALPCPDTKATPDGTADASCTGTTAVAGVLPWVTMGVAKDQVVDGFGNYYTYVLSQTAKTMCAQVTGDLTGATNTTTYTGALLDPTDLTYTSAEGIERNVPFVIISHGKNGRGAKRAGGTDIADPPGSATYELANVTVATPTDTVYGGPTGEDFDDIVLVPTLAELRKSCEQLTPAGKLNAEVSDNFEGAGALSNTFDTTGSGTPPTKTRDDNGNGVARFTDATSFLATRSDVVLDALSRPVYARMLWTAAAESPAAADAGFSIATRATPSELAAGTDDFTGGSQRGITFRFDDRDGSTSSSVGVTNTLSIRNDGAAEVVTGTDPTYSLINGETYILEVYDNGGTVWMRITQRDDVTNTATVSATVSDDLSGGSQRVVFINGPAISHVDEVTVGLPMLALETGPTTGIARTATNVGGTSTGDLTLEAWIRPKALPATGARGTIAAQWNTTGSASQQSFRLYLDGDTDGRLVFEIGGDFDDNGTDGTERFNLGLVPTLDQWTHVAVSFDSGASKAVRFYVNGAFSRSFSSATDTGTGVRSPQRPLSAGAALDSNTPVDFFTGLISDLRVWEAVRTPADIEDTFDVRLTSAGSEDDLVLNWVFDRESGTIGASSNVIARPADAANDGILTGATYAPTLAVYFRPLSTSICPAGTRVGPYQCDFRTTSSSGMTASINMPNNLTDIYAKVWGAGGGAYDNTTAAGTYDTSGGSGGFSQGIIRSINGTSVASQVLDVYVGGGGTGSTTNAFGAGGGGGSGIYTVGGDAGLVAGGGGGGSYSLRNVTVGGNCAGLVDGTRCGLGGLGGGAGALTVRANDQASNCGGRGGDNGPFGSDPPSAGADCAQGGANPSGRTGGDGGSTAGGGPIFLAGGGGYDAGVAFANIIGGGGGGGGAVGGEAGGYRIASNQRAGFGGGGGSGTADAGVLNAMGELGVLQGSVYGSSASSGDRTNGQTLVTLIDPVEILSWQVGYIVVGNGIPNGTTIAAIDTGANTITLSVAATNNNNGVLIVTSPPSAGGSSDPYYSPSYIGTTYRNPGRTGLDNISVNGHAGAVVLLW